jgi:hypothetical protein
MKPTKEQLADPKWWDEQTLIKYNFCYWDPNYNSCVFRREIGPYGELLAKRPEDKWKPEVGEECEVSTVLDGWCKRYYIGIAKNGEYIVENHIGKISRHHKSKVRPLKNQREEFIDKAARASKHFGIHLADIMGELYDAGCRFELTEKDGE